MERSDTEVDWRLVGKRGQFDSSIRASWARSAQGRGGLRFITVVEWLRAHGRFDLLHVPFVTGGANPSSLSALLRVLARNSNLVPFLNLNAGDVRPGAATSAAVSSGGMIASMGAGLEHLAGPVSSRAGCNHGSWSGRNNCRNDYDPGGLQDGGVNRSAVFSPHNEELSTDMSFMIEQPASAHGIGKDSGFTGKKMTFDEAYSRRGDKGWSKHYLENFDLQVKQVKEELTYLTSYMRFRGIPHLKSIKCFWNRLLCVWGGFTSREQHTRENLQACR